MWDSSARGSIKLPQNQFPQGHNLHKHSGGYFAWALIKIKAHIGPRSRETDRDGPHRLIHCGGPAEPSKQEVAASKTLCVGVFENRMEGHATDKFGVEVLAVGKESGHRFKGKDGAREHLTNDGNAKKRLNCSVLKMS